MRKRCHEFLELLSEKYELILYTSAKKNYADLAIEMLIDPEMKYFKHILYRDSCLKLDGKYLKDIARLSQDRKIDSIFLIEADFEQAKMYPKNTIYVPFICEDNFDNPDFNSEESSSDS